VICLKKKWYVIQTYSGLEEKIKESIEKKRDTLNLERLVGRVVIPEEVVVEPSKAHTVKHMLSQKAKLHVTTGDEVKKGDLIAEENPVKLRHDGIVDTIRNYRKIVVETLDSKYTKIYYIPEADKIESGIKSGVKIRQGMPFAKNGEYICEMDGTVLESIKVKKVIIKKDDGEEDVYYVPLKLFLQSKASKGKEVEKGTEISEPLNLRAEFDALIEISDRGTRRILKLVNIKRRRLFPGYVFLEMAMTDAAWNTVQSVPNVVHFVSSGAAPLPIKDKEAKVILRLAGLETVEKADKKAATVEIEYEVGEAVRIKSGAFADFVGTISEIHPDKHELKVMVNIFGRETPVVVHLSEVEKV